MKNQYISKVYLLFVAIVSIALIFGISVSQPLVLFCFLLAIAIIGVPHGALDFHIAKNLKSEPSLKWQLGFLTLYLLITLFSISMWLVLPSFGLVVFLLISTYHFSSDWATLLPKRICLFLSGFILCAPALLYQSSIIEIFTILLVPQNHALIISITMQFLALALAGLLLLQIRVLFAALKKQSLLAIEIAVMLLSAVLLPPLIHFVLYFCFLHSIKHWSKVSENLQLDFKQMSYIAAPIVIITIIGSIIAWFVFPKDEMSADVFQLVFIGLFGLTIAHMILIEKWQRALEEKC